MLNKVILLFLLPFFGDKSQLHGVDGSPKEAFLTLVCQKCPFSDQKKWHFEWPNQNSKTTFIVQMPPGRRMLEQERMPSTLKALQAVFNLYCRSIPCSIQYLLHAIERQNIAPVQLGGCTVYTIEMQCNQVNIKCITNQLFRPQQYN